MLLTVERKQLDALAHRTGLNEPQRVAEVLTGKFRKIAISFMDPMSYRAARFFVLACPSFTARSWASIRVSSTWRWSTICTCSVSNEQGFAAISTQLWSIRYSADESLATSGGGSVGGKAGGSGGRDARGLWIGRQAWRYRAHDPILSCADGVADYVDYLGLDYFFKVRFGQSFAFPSSGRFDHSIGAVAAPQTVRCRRLQDRLPLRVREARLAPAEEVCWAASSAVRSQVHLNGSGRPRNRLLSRSGRAVSPGGPERSIHVSI